MICYSKYNSTSLEKGSVPGLMPIISVRSKFQNVQTDNEDDFILGLLTNNKGYVIFENKRDPDVIESATGVTTGGTIVVGPTKVAVIYKEADDFSVILLNNSKMKPSFYEVSPLRYFATDGARGIGSLPNGYLPLRGGVIESFSTDDCVNLPYFKRALLVNGTPYAYYGLQSGALGINFKPKTKKGGLGYLVRNRLYGTSIFSMSEDRGVVLATPTRQKGRLFASAIANGTKLPNVSFCKSYLAPKSILLDIPTTYYCLKAGVDGAEVYCFGYSNDEVGIGVREFINGEQAGVYTLGSPDINEIFNQYNGVLEKSRKEPFSESLINSVITVRGIIDQVKNFRFELEHEVEVKTECFDIKPKISLLGLTLPPPISKPRLLTKLEIAEWSADKVKQELLSTLTKLGAFSRFVSFDQGNAKFDEENFNSYCAEVANNIIHAIEEQIKEPFDIIERSVVSFSPNETCYSYRSGCKKKKKYYDNYASWQGIVNNVGSNLKVYGVSNSGDPLATAGGLLKYWRFEKIKVTSISFANGALNFSYEIQGVGSHVGKIHAGFGYSKAETDFGKILRMIFDSSGYNVSTNGIATMNPFGLRTWSGSTSFKGCSFHRQCMIDGDNYVCPGFSFNLSRSVQIPISLNFSSDATLDVLQGQISEFIENVETKAQNLATKWLMDKLTEEGLITRALIVGKVDDVVLPLQSFVKLASFKPAETLINFWSCFSSVNKLELSSLEKYNVETNLQNLASALADLGYEIKDGVPVGNQSNLKKPWIMDFEHMTYEYSGTDLLLLPFYCSL